MLFFYHLPLAGKGSRSTEGKEDWEVCQSGEKGPQGRDSWRASRADRVVWGGLAPLSALFPGGPSSSSIFPPHVSDPAGSLGGVGPAGGGSPGEGHLWLPPQTCAGRWWAEHCLSSALAPGPVSSEAASLGSAQTSS